MSISSRKSSNSSSISIELLRLFLIHSTLLILTANCSYRFSEELFVDPLHDSFVQFFFQFQSDLEINHSSYVENYELFPKRIGDIAKKFEINELSLKLSQGTWRYDEWGFPITSAPSGGELWARFGSDSKELIDSNWLKSSRAISGLFGLSINLEENPNTIIPKHINISSTNLRYASIPNEIVCTENLTPWLKLLPCGSYKGLAQLFKSSPRLFESHYFMPSLYFKRTCLDPSCTTERLELRQTLTVVYDMNILIRQLTTDQISFSLSNVFLKTINGYCPVAYLSKVYMNLRNAAATSLESNEQVYSEITKSKVDVFDLIEFFKTSQEFNPIISQKKIKTAFKSIVSTHRYITDKNERNFGLKTLIRNDYSERLSIVYLDVIPWYFRVYISTLVVMDENRNIWIKPDDVHFVPGLDRKRPHHIELKLNLEPKSVYSIYFKAELAYLKWDEFPPDVNHGFYINPAIVQIDFYDNFKYLTHYRHPYASSNIYENLKQATTSGNRNIKINIYSETLIMNLPTPDFSMPYNVICLTCTVIAIGFGSIHNFTTRRFIFLESKSLKDKMNKLKEKIRSFFRRG